MPTRRKLPDYGRSKRYLSYHTAETIARLKYGVVRMVLAGPTNYFRYGELKRRLCLRRLNEFRYNLLKENRLSL